MAAGGRAAELRTALKEAQEERELLQAKFSAAMNELAALFAAVTPGPFAATFLMSSSLVDKEGFPMAGLDIYRVRHLRQTAACLKNDLAAQELKLEQMLHELHETVRPMLPPEEVRRLDPSTAGVAKQHKTASASAVVGVEAGVGASATSSTPESDLDVAWASVAPFALVDAVSPGSPAAEAGIQVGDSFLAFEDLRGDNGEPIPLKAIGAAVQRSIGKAIGIVVRRGSKALTLTLTPRTWAGPGLLGCHIAPPLAVM